MNKSKRYFGIWSASSKKFVFGIKEKTKTEAWKKLSNKIGYDSLKYRFSAKEIKERN